MIYKTQGIILKKNKLGENDEIITCYSEKFGKIRFVAKGSKNIKSKFVGSLEKLNFCELIISSGKNLDILNEAKIISVFPKIKSDIKKINQALYLSEILDKFAHDKEKNQNIFNLFLRTLKYLEKNKISLAPILNFEISLINNFGYKPVLDKCTNCGSPLGKDIYFSFQLGGALCQDCLKFDAHSTKIDKNLVKIWNKNKIGENQKEADLKKMLKIINFFVTFITEQKIKSEKFLYE